jgi:hypothetical protein
MMQTYTQDRSYPCKMIKNSRNSAVSPDSHTVIFSHIIDLNEPILLVLSRQKTSLPITRLRLLHLGCMSVFPRIRNSPSYTASVFRTVASCYSYNAINDIAFRVISKLSAPCILIQYFYVTYQLNTLTIYDITVTLLQHVSASQ